MTSGLRLGRSMRWWFYGAFGTLLASGVLWLLADALPGARAGRGAAWIKPWLLEVHGAAAMAALLALGVLIPVHAQRAWARRRNRATAVVLVTVTALLIVTAWGLYYAGDEAWRRWVAAIHDVAGCALPLILLGHVALGRRSRVTRPLAVRSRAARRALLALTAAGLVLAAPAPTGAADYLPGPAASRVVSVTREGEAEAELTVLTRAVAEKETGPAETVARFGEIYVFSPGLIAVRDDEPTRIDFWNLQPDDTHDFMLVDAGLNVLMKVTLPPLSKTSYVFTFHREGLFVFYCSYHQPAMAGQILVLPAAQARPAGPRTPHR